MKFIAALSTLVALLLISSCQSEDPTTGKLAPAKFEAPHNNTTYRIGKDIPIHISVSNIEDIENMRVLTKDTVLFEGKPTSTSLQFNVNSKNWNIGTNQILLEVKSKDQTVVRKSHRIVKVIPDTFPTEYTAEVVKTFPHATTSYTQGLEFDGDQLYEGTGGQSPTGQSLVAKVDLNTGKIITKKMLDDKYFGEGITILNNKLYQLTWKEHTCFVYDKESLEEIKTFTYSGEGWGLCNDGENLIMSDGSERLYFRDPNTFKVLKTIEVYSNQGPIQGINELEYIQGKIYANIYTTDQIVIIDAETGIVTGRIDASLLAIDYRKTGEVLNGIAYKKSTKELFVTGKNWPNLLLINLVEE